MYINIYMYTHTHICIYMPFLMRPVTHSYESRHACNGFMPHTWSCHNTLQRTATQTAPHWHSTLPCTAVHR